MSETTYLYHVYEVIGNRKEWIYCTCCNDQHFQMRFAELKQANPNKQFTYQRLK